ncbi:MAG: rhodanese-like domain-containing protein [bacterium]
MFDGVAPFVLDVRRRVEFAQGNIAGACNIAHTRLLGKLAEIPRDRPILVHCQLGGRSARAAALLAKHGHRVTNLAGGFAAWKSHTSEVAAKKAACGTQVCGT